MKKTGFFALFVAVLVAVTYYFEFYKATKDEQKKQESLQVITLPPEQIHQVRLQNAKGVVLLKREVDGWRLEEPVKDSADNGFVEDWLNSLTTEKSLDVAAEGPNLNWSLYGLDKPAAQLTLTAQNGQSQKLAVSGKKNFEGNLFLRRNEEGKALVVSGQWDARTDKTGLDFRDRRLFRGRIGSVEKIEVKSMEDHFQLVQKDQRWVAVEHPELNLDQNIVHEVLTSLNEVKAQDFVSEVPPKAASKASLKLTLTDKTWSADFKVAPDKSVYAVVSEPAFILKMDPSQSGQYLQMNIASLRDRSEAFSFDKAAVQKIELQTKLKKMTLVQVQGTWKVEGDEKAPLDSAKVPAMLDRLKESRVSEFIDKKQAEAFQNPENKMVLLDGHGKSLLELSWGPLLPKKKSSVETPLVLARSSLYKDVFALDQAVVDSWGLLDLNSPTPAHGKKDAQ